MASQGTAGSDRAEPRVDKQLVRALERLLAERCGYRFADVQRRTLEDAIRRRLAACVGTGSEDYLSRVRASTPTTGELAALLTEFTNTETHFFRHEGRFHLLREHVVPALVVRRPSGSPLRVLSAGCSSGEEVYSTIMALLEIEDIWARYGLEVVGCDINERALARARDARYGAWTLRYTPERFLKRYFEPLDETKKRWSVVEAIRRYAKFRRVNLVDDGLLSLPGMQDFDVVFCCNVMIYFDEPTVERLMDRLCGLLGPRGFLFVGYTESLHARRRDFAPIWSNDYVVYRLAVPDEARADATPPSTRVTPASRPRAAPAVAPKRRPKPADVHKRVARTPAVQPRPAPPVEPAPTPDVEPSYHRALQHCRCDRQQEALRDVDRVLEASPFHWRARLLKGYLHGSRGEFWAAVAECTKVLDIDPICAQAYLLLGMLLEQQGEVDSAVRETKRAIYLDPELPLAYFTLGKLYRSASDPRAAARQFANTARLLRAKPNVPVAADIPVEFDRRVLLQLAEQQLAKLDDR